MQLATGARTTTTTTTMRKLLSSSFRRAMMSMWRGGRATTSHLAADGRIPTTHTTRRGITTITTHATTTHRDTDDQGQGQGGRKQMKMTETLRVKKLSETATLPVRGSDGAAGYDLARYEKMTTKILWVSPGSDDDDRMGWGDRTPRPRATDARNFKFLKMLTG